MNVNITNRSLLGTKVWLLCPRIFPLGRGIFHIILSFSSFVVYQFSFKFFWFSLFHLLSFKVSSHFWYCISIFSIKDIIWLKLQNVNWNMMQSVLSAFSLLREQPHADWYVADDRSLWAHSLTVKKICTCKKFSCRLLRQKPA